MNEPENAIKYAEICLETSLKDNVDKVYLGYAYEALAGADKLAADAEKASDFMREAKEIASEVKKEDREQLTADLELI